MLWIYLLYFLLLQFNDSELLGIDDESQKCVKPYFQRNYLDAPTQDGRLTNTSVLTRWSKMVQK